VEKECLQWHSCGECLLSGCFFCDPNATTTDNSYCVAGNITPYISNTCMKDGWNSSRLQNCRHDHPAATPLVAATIVVLILIAILVIATYVVDWKKGKAASSGYEPIIG